MKIEEPVEAWLHLKQYGYAPGWYCSKCLTCGESKPFLDKHAWCCKECAEKKHDN